MRNPVVAIVLAACTLAPAAHAADLTYVPRSRQAVAVQQLSRPIVRLADQELGYSVLHGTPDPRRGYRVHVTCTLDDSFMQTYCPTTAYFASCPRAQISCQ